MAVTNTPQNGKLCLDVVTTVNGKDTVKRRSLAGLKATATDQDVMDVANSLAALQSLPLSGVARTGEGKLTAE